MNRAPITVRWGAGASRQLCPTTLDKLAKNEEFLESVLAEHPELLGIQNRRTGIRGPFAVFRQVPLPTPAGREIYPDIALLSASGHFIVVEVKLNRNPELKDRRVIAQIIDYAASFSALSEERLLAVFGRTTGSWTEFVQELFPEESSIKELADLLLERAGSGALNLVIACDVVPPGVPEIVSGIASQQTTAFDLDLVEVLPFVDPEGNDADEIIFVPTAKLSTEIVGRTTVTVTYQEGSVCPEASVDAVRPAEIQERMEQVTKKTSPARVWPPEEVEEVFRNGGSPEDIRLLEFAKQHSVDGEFVSPAVKNDATFGFRVAGRRADGTIVKHMFFFYTYGWEHIVFYLNMMAALVEQEVFEQLRVRLKGCLSEDINIDQKQPSVKVTAVRENLDQFLEILLWFQQQAVRSLSEP